MLEILEKVKVKNNLNNIKLLNHLINNKDFLEKMHHQKDKKY